MENKLSKNKINRKLLRDFHKISLKLYEKNNELFYDNNSSFAKNYFNGLWSLINIRPNHHHLDFKDILKITIDRIELVMNNEQFKTEMTDFLQEIKEQFESIAIIVELTKEE